MWRGTCDGYVDDILNPNQDAKKLLVLWRYGEVIVTSVEKDALLPVFVFVLVAQPAWSVIFHIFLKPVQSH